MNYRQLPYRWRRFWEAPLARWFAGTFLPVVIIVAAVFLWWVMTHLFSIPIPVY